MQFRSKPNKNRGRKLTAIEKEQRAQSRTWNKATKAPKVRTPAEKQRAKEYRERRKRGFSKKSLALLV